MKGAGHLERRVRKTPIKAKKPYTGKPRGRKPVNHIPADVVLSQADTKFSWTDAFSQSKRYRKGDSIVFLEGRAGF